MAMANEILTWVQSNWTVLGVVAAFVISLWRGSEKASQNEQEIMALKTTIKTLKDYTEEKVSEIKDEAVESRERSAVILAEISKTLQYMAEADQKMEQSVARIEERLYHLSSGRGDAE